MYTKISIQIRQLMTTRYVFISKLIINLLNVSFFFILSIYLSSADFGNLMVTYSFAFIVYQISCGAMQTNLYKKFLSAEIDVDYYRKLGITIAAVNFLFSIGLAYLSYLLNIFTFDSFIYVYLTITFLVYFALIDFFSCYFRRIEKMHFLLLMEVMPRLGGMILLVLQLIYVEYLAVIVFTIIALIGLTYLSGQYVKISHHEMRMRDVIIENTDVYLYLIMLLGMLFGHIDLLLVDLYLGGDAAGNYRQITLIIGLLPGVLGSMNYSVNKEISDISRKLKRELNDALKAYSSLRRKYFSFCAVITTFLTVVLACIFVMNDTPGELIFCSCCLLLAQVINFCVGPVGVMLHYLNRNNIVLPIASLSVVLYVMIIILGEGTYVSFGVASLFAMVFSQMLLEIKRRTEMVKKQCW